MPFLDAAFATRSLFPNTNVCVCVRGGCSIVEAKYHDGLLVQTSRQMGSSEAARTFWPNAPPKLDDANWPARMSLARSNRGAVAAQFV